MVGGHLEFLNVAFSNHPDLKLSKLSGVTDRVVVQKMITEFLTSRVFVHTDFVRIYILSKIYMSNIMFLFQIMGVKNAKCLCVTYKSSITS